MVAAAETHAMHQAASAASLLEGESQLVSSHLGHQVRFLEQLAWCTLAKNSWSEVPVSLWRCPDAGIMQEGLCSAVRKPLLGGDEGWY